MWADPQIAPRRRRSTRAWDLAVLAVIGCAAVVYCWALPEQSWGNAYYAAAAQAGATSWKAMFFGSLDAHSVLATDKPPLSFWITSASVRLFGLSSVSLIAPMVAQSLATVAILARTVRRQAGPQAALIATVVLATTPVFLVMARSNFPDVTLNLAFAIAAYALTRFVEAPAARWLAVLGLALGAGFMSKWLVVGILAPSVAVALWQARRRYRYARAAGIAALVAAAAGLWWVAVLALIGPSARPYLDASDGSLFRLILGRNGVGRLAGRSSAQSINGHPGPLRLLLWPFDGQIGWLLPVALIALVVPFALKGWDSRAKIDSQWHRLWGTWLVVGAALLSVMGGAMHAYYSLAVSLPIAALVALSVSDLVHAAYDGHRIGRNLLLGSLAVGGLTAALTVHAHAGQMRGLAPAAYLGLAILYAAALVGALTIGPLGPPRRQAVACLVSAAVLVAAPAAFGIATLGHPVTGADPLAGPGRSVPMRQFDPAVMAYLRAHQRGQLWAAAVPRATDAARLQLALGMPVLPLGGFMGTVPAPTLSQVRHWVQTRSLRYLVVSERMHPLKRGERAGGSEGSGTIVAWGRAHGCVVHLPAGGVTAIDLWARDCRR